MSFNLEDVIPGGVPKPPRILFLGVEGIGKTTFAARCTSDGLPTEATKRVLFIPANKEQGCDGVQVAQTPPVNNFSELMDIFGALIGAEDLKYDQVVLDSATSYEPIVIAEAINRDSRANSVETLNGGYGNQELAINAVWGDICEALDALRERGVSCILTGHVKVRKARDPMVPDDYDTFEQDIRVSGANYLQRWADGVLFANYRTFLNADTKRGKGEGERVLYTQKRPGHPGKVRHIFGVLPYSMALDWRVWDEALNQSTNNETEEK